MTKSIATIIQENIWNIIIMTAGFIIAWSALNNTVNNLEVKAQENKDRIEQQDQTYKLILQKLTAIETNQANQEKLLEEVRMDLKSHIEKSNN